MPADVDENDTALETLFSEGGRLGLGLSGFLLEIHDSRLLSGPVESDEGREEYPPSSDYFDDIDPLDFTCNGSTF